MAEKNVEKLRKKSKAASDRWQGQGQWQDTDRLGGRRGAAEWAPGRLENFADFLTRRPGRSQKAAQAQAKTLKILFDTLAAAADVAVAVAVAVAVGVLVV